MRLCLSRVPDHIRTRARLRQNKSASSPAAESNVHPTDIFMRGCGALQRHESFVSLFFNVYLLIRIYATITGRIGASQSV
jgi:hypothetical protein